MCSQSLGGARDDERAERNVEWICTWFVGICVAMREGHRVVHLALGVAVQRGVDVVVKREVPFCQLQRPRFVLARDVAKLTPQPVGFFPWLPVGAASTKINCGCSVSLI